MELLAPPELAPPEAEDPLEDAEEGGTGRGSGSFTRLHQKAVKTVRQLNGLANVHAAFVVYSDAGTVKYEPADLKEAVRVAMHVDDLESRGAARRGSDAFHPHMNVFVKPLALGRVDGEEEQPGDAGGVGTLLGREGKQSTQWRVLLEAGGVVVVPQKRMMPWTVERRREGEGQQEPQFPGPTPKERCEQALARSRADRKRVRELEAALEAQKADQEARAKKMKLMESQLFLLSSSLRQAHLQVSTHLSQIAQLSTGVASKSMGAKEDGLMDIEGACRAMLPAPEFDALRTSVDGSFKFGQRRPLQGSRLRACATVASKLMHWIYDQCGGDSITIMNAVLTRRENKKLKEGILGAPAAARKDGDQPFFETLRDAYQMAKQANDYRSAKMVLSMLVHCGKTERELCDEVEGVTRAAIYAAKKHSGQKYPGAPVDPIKRNRKRKADEANGSSEAAHGLSMAHGMPQAMPQGMAMLSTMVPAPRMASSLANDLGPPTTAGIAHAQPGSSGLAQRLAQGLHHGVAEALVHGAAQSTPHGLAPSIASRSETGGGFENGAGADPTSSAGDGGSLVAAQPSLTSRYE